MTGTQKVVTLARLRAPSEWRSTPRWHVITGIPHNQTIATTVCLLQYRSRHLVNWRIYYGDFENAPVNICETCREVVENARLLAGLRGEL